MFPFKRNQEKLEEPIKPVRRRKKEEPQKPWGKLERILVFILLTGIPLLSIFFFLNSKKSGKAQKPNIDPPRIISQISEGNHDISKLKDKLTNEIQNLKGTYGIWVEALDGNFKLGINENIQFEGSSLFKLPMMIAYYKKVDDGTISPNNTYTLKFSDSGAGSGPLANLPVGTVVTYRDLVQTMGKNSDNEAFQIMGNILGFNSEVNIIKDLSMQNTDFKNSLTTPRDIGNLFYEIINTNIVSDNSKKEFISFLENTNFENLIAAGAPQNIKVAHKYGSFDNNLNDAGIVYSTRPYILVILSKDVDLNEANTEIPKISQIVYDWTR